MSSKGISVFTSLLCLWAGACSAAQTVGQGTIEFRGSIVEPGCATNARSVPVIDVKGCADTGQRYVPVGCAGQPILPGKYVVTVTTP